MIEADGGDAPLRVRLLGGFQVTVGERALDAADLRLRAAQQLIKLLALAPGRQLHREQVIEALWPERPPHAAVNSLNQALFAARRALAAAGAPESRYLTLRALTLRLGDPRDVWVDAEEFAAAAEAALRQRDPDLAAAALARYPGDLLPDDLYDAWLDTRRAALRHSFRSLAIALAGWVEGSPSADRAIAPLQQALASDPTDEELHRALMRIAARSGARQQAARQYERMRRALQGDLGLDPDPVSQDLHRAIMAGQLDPAPRDRPHNLPAALTSFVGRAREVATVRDRLGAARLLTIVGAGGSGKTRLAIEAARSLPPAFPDGVWLIELAALSDPALVARAAATAIGLREAQGIGPAEQLLEHLAARRALLLLDNCEHLVAACAQLAEDLLRGCPDLRILATSREPLRAGGESTWPIPALSLPGQRTPPTIAEVAQYEALQLFVERASAQGAFALRERDIAALTQICARLDGMPLAIELAAARIPALTLQQIADRLDDRFQLLSAGSRTALTRQQTLRAAIDWSYDLLTTPERILLQRLSVFAGGWTLEAAEAVCPDDLLRGDAVPALLAQLVDKSLAVARDAGEQRRYELLETVRQYARERLEEAGELPALRGRHQAWCLQLAAQGEVELTGPRQVAWLGRLSPELANFRAALQWGAASDRDDAPWLRLAYRLFWFWYLSSSVGEGRAAFERALADPATSELPWARGVALLGSGAMALYQGELRTARARLEESLPILRADGDPFSQALAPFMAGTIAVNQGDHAAAQALLEESLPRFAALGHRQGEATALLHLGDVALGLGDPSGARARYEDCLAIHRAHTGSTWGIAQALNNLGEVARALGAGEEAAARYREALALFHQLATRADVARTLHNLAALALTAGDRAEAEAGFHESLALFRECGNCRGIVECIAGIACLLADQPTPEEAERGAALLAFAEAYLSASGAAMWPPDRQSAQRARAALAARLSPDQAHAAAARGSTLTIAQATAIALAPSSAAPSQ